MNKRKKIKITAYLIEKEYNKLKELAYQTGQTITGLLNQILVDFNQKGVN